MSLERPWPFYLLGGDGQDADELAAVEGEEDLDAFGLAVARMQK